MDKKMPKIGVGVYIFHAGKVLFLHRKTENAQGTWSPPGGHLEFGEDILACAAREALEEVGVNIENSQIFSITNDIMADKHYVTLHVAAQTKSPDFQNLEPEKHDQISWVEWNNLPQPLMPTIVNMMQQGDVPPYVKKEGV